MITMIAWETRQSGERDIAAAVIDLDTGAIGIGVHHADAYRDLGYEVPENDAPLSEAFAGNFLQGYLTNQSRFHDGTGKVTRPELRVDQIEVWLH